MKNKKTYLGSSEWARILVFADKNRDWFETKDFCTGWKWKRHFVGYMSGTRIGDLCRLGLLDIRPHATKKHYKQYRLRDSVTIEKVGNTLFVKHKFTDDEVI